MYDTICALHNMDSGRTSQKIIFVLIDGLADVSVSELNDATPLSHAVTPAMDRIACKGSD